MNKIEEHYNSLTWRQKLAFNILWVLCCIVRFMPRWFRFGVIRPFLSWIFRLIGYRRDVILRNLANAFPEKSELERQNIMRRYYITLAEVFVNTISLVNATPKRDGKALICSGAKEHIEKNKNRDWIAMASHFGCWEFFPMWGWIDTDCEFLSVYHPLKNSVFEHFYLRIRSFAPNIVPVTMAESLRYYIKNRNRGHNMVLGLISDQSPVLRADTEWIDFLNQPTAFIDGSEKLALRFGIPVYFIDIERRAADSYHLNFIEIYDGEESVAPNEITRRYAEKLESMIRKSPELWLWSHKRWKHTSAKQARLFKNKSNNK
ncbi:MAG: lysophospholipid acyltransferase family protein [Muribaculaceae bacterium]|nr:lysophospholipid acyltransferase family protein [Bacteroidales bacterium]MBR5240995.1 lysophospholipid acyltransferase family protein [Muribaculaceae bacterium]MBR5533215.1 lysophospholipid acyltransferase family protein [Bacteroidales bacterium]